MPEFPVSSRQAALDAIAAVPNGGLIASDCDNTLWSADVGDDLVRLAEARPALFGGTQISLADYLAEVDSDYEGACLRSAALMAAAPDRGAVRAALAEMLRPAIGRRDWLVDALLAARARGVRLAAVSASALDTVEVGLELCGLRDAFEIFGVQCGAAGPVAPWPIGHGKAAVLRASGLPRPDLALGDSPWDGPMLAYARLGVRVARAIDDDGVETHA